MHSYFRILIAAVLTAIFIGTFPSSVHAQAPDGSLSECIEISAGDQDAFLECVADLRESLH
ncbi:MAG: hypothetical protein PVH60_11010, partial [Anaerolineales bacterium]